MGRFPRSTADPVASSARRRSHRPGRPAPVGTGTARRRAVGLLAAVGLLVGACSGSSAHKASGPTGPAGPTSVGAGGVTTGAPATNPGPAVRTVPGMPPVVDPRDIYSEAAAGKLSPAAANARPLVYVPDHATNNITLIDPATFLVVGVVPVGLNPQHVIPSWDLTRLWVANNADGTTRGSLTPIDPVTGKTGANVVVDDPYNLYFTPDGAYAIVVAEARRRLDFRDPRTMALKFSIPTPTCLGINHMDFAIDGSYLIATCEDASRLVKVDWRAQRVIGTLDLGGALPQDIRLSPDGTTFYVADMAGNRLLLVDGTALGLKGSIDLAATGGYGAHGLYPSRDGTRLYVANRGSAARTGAPHHGRGSVSVVDFATNRVLANWPVPGGGSPDMGGVNADGTQLWLSGRFDNEVYVFDTVAGKLAHRIAVGPAGGEPHGLCVWPQPGRYSLGHTGNMR